MSNAVAVSQAGKEPFSRRGWAAVLLVLCLASSLVAIFYPAWVIQPFRAQSAKELAAALAFVRFSPIATLVAAVTGVAATTALRPRGWAKRAAAVVALVLLLASAVLARVDYFEWMFHPDPHPRFVSNKEAPVDADDMVIVVHAGGDAHAYPVRFMAYHHVVNDTVGGVPLVSTY